MSDQKPPAIPSGRSRFPWRSVFQRSSSALFVVATNRRLRYANPAWELATGITFANVRGAKLPTQKTTDSLAGTIAPPPEAWEGHIVTVRRPAPTATHGPPWWNITFLPLTAVESKTPLAILGVLSIVPGPTSERASLPAALAAEQANTAGRYTLDALDGPSTGSRRLVSQVRAAAASNAPIWIQGEAGTGRETVARVIHHTGRHREQAFVALDCRGLQPYLIEGILFGKGGLATSRRVGTLFLKLPEALTRDLQQRIVRWSDAKAGPRLISASHSTAATAVAAGSLLADFDERLSAIALQLPPLRDRLDDLPRLVPSIVKNLHPGVGEPDASIYPVLHAHTWPGNIRELTTVLAQAIEAAAGAPIHAEHLPRYVRERHLIASDPRPPVKAVHLDAVLEAVERRLIQLALAKANGNQTEAAASLGIFRTRLGRRIEALGLDKLKPES